MKKKKGHKDTGESIVDAELLRMYLMGAANPKNSTKISAAEDVIDLHLHQSQVGKGKIPAHDALFHQIEEFERALDRAIAAGKMEFRVVHGHGTGKLKKEIYSILAKHPQVKSYENTYHSQFGYGSTIIFLK
ncbi:MAG: Smr/MutS family protein [Chitinophagales bacterium]